MRLAVSRLSDSRPEGEEKGEGQGPLRKKKWKQDEKNMERKSTNMPRSSRTMVGLTSPSSISALDVGIQGQPSRPQGRLGLRKLGVQKGPQSLFLLKKGLSF